MALASAFLTGGVSKAGVAPELDGLPGRQSHHRDRGDVDQAGQRVVSDRGHLQGGQRQHAQHPEPHPDDRLPVAGPDEAAADPAHRLVG